MIIFIVIFILFFNLIDFLVYRYDRIFIKTALIKNQSYSGKFFKSSWTKNLYLYISFKSIFSFIFFETAVFKNFFFCDKVVISS